MLLDRPSKSYNKCAVYDNLTVLRFEQAVWGVLKYDTITFIAGKILQLITIEERPFKKKV